MKVSVNGAEHELPEELNLRELLEAVGIPRTDVAVALDGDVITRSQWDQVMIIEGAAVEVVTAVQGG